MTVNYWVSLAVAFGAALVAHLRRHHAPARPRAATGGDGCLRLPHHPAGRNAARHRQRPQHRPAAAPDRRDQRCPPAGAPQLPPRAGALRAAADPARRRRGARAARHRAIPAAQRDRHRDPRGVGERRARADARRRRRPGHRPHLDARRCAVGSRLGPARRWWPRRRRHRRRGSGVVAASVPCSSCWSSHDWSACRWSLPAGSPSGCCWRRCSSPSAAPTTSSAHCCSSSARCCSSSAGIPAGPTPIRRAPTSPAGRPVPSRASWPDVPERAHAATRPAPGSGGRPRRAFRSCSRPARPAPSRRPSCSRSWGCRCSFSPAGAAWSASGSSASRPSEPGPRPRPACRSCSRCRSAWWRVVSSRSPSAYPPCASSH